MSTDTSAQRAAFEAWFAESRKSKGPSRRPTFERFVEDGTYADDSTQRHWWTWQHAASPQPTAAPVAELVEALRIFVGCALPVSTEIDKRGHRWTEAYLDQALPIGIAALERAALSRAPGAGMPKVRGEPGR